MSGPTVSIRRFAVQPIEIDDLIAYQSLTPEIKELLFEIIRGRLNVLISGGTGSGKTILFNVLSRFIAVNELIVTIRGCGRIAAQTGACRAFGDPLGQY